MERPTPPVTISSSLASNGTTVASAEVTAPHQKRSRAEKALRRIHTLQVHGFIEAAEVVEVDRETIEDILDGFDNGEHCDSQDGDEDELPTAFSHDDPDAHDEWASIFPYLKEGEDLE